MDQTTPIGASSPLDRTTPVGQTPKPAPRLVTPPAPQPAPLLQPTDSEELDALEPTDIVVSPQPALPAAAVQHSTQAIEIEEPAQTSRGLLVALVLVSISLGIAAAFVGPKIWAQLNRGKGTPRTSATALIAQIPQAEVATPTSVPPTMIPPTSTQVVALAVPPTPDSQEVPLNPTEIPSPTEIPTLPATETPVPTEDPTQTPEPSPTPEPPTPVPTETPLPTEPPKAVQEPTKKPTKTPAPAQPTQAPTPKPTKAAPTVPPTPKPAKPSPTQPAVAAVVDNIIIGGLPADAEVCVDGVASKATKQGLSFILNGIQAGSRKLGFTSKQKGSAQKNVEILGDGQRNAPIKLQPADWKAPRYRVVLQAGAEKVELEKPVDGHDEIKLKSGETITVSLSLQDTKLTIRRADGREHEKFCPWQERASCGPLPVLSCGTVPVPQ